MNQLKSMLTCSTCSHIFKDPIELPCTHSICREHLIEDSVRKSNNIRCTECNQEFKVKDNEFKPNYFGKLLIDDKCYLKSKNQFETSMKCAINSK